MEPADKPADLPVEDLRDEQADKPTDMLRDVQADEPAEVPVDKSTNLAGEDLRAEILDLLVTSQEISQLRSR